MSESNGNSFLTLDLNAGPIPFSDVEELNLWFRNEQNAFEWLSALHNVDTSAGQTWRLFSEWFNVVHNFIHAFKSHYGDERQQASLINAFLDNVKTFFQARKLKSSESADVQFVFGLRETRTNTVAGYALSQLMGQGISFNTADAIEGVFLALQYKKGIPETVDAQRKELESLKKGWATRFGKQHQAIKDKGSQLVAQIAEHEETFASINNKSTAFYGAEEKRFEALYKKIEEELSEIKRIYDEKLALQSSVAYWGSKRTHHGKVMLWIGIATLVLGLGTMGVFMHQASGLVNETITQVPLAKLSILLAVSTAGIWLTRLCTKIFVSNLHLRTDADERVTMIQTYLALLREGNGPKEDDLQLILPSLFRPTSTGFIKEDGPAGFFELAKAFKRDPT